MKNLEQARKFLKDNNIGLSDYAKYKEAVEQGKDAFGTKLGKALATDSAPTGNEINDAVLAASYFIKDQESGNNLPNYDVVLTRDYPANAELIDLSKSGLVDVVQARDGQTVIREIGILKAMDSTGILVDVTGNNKKTNIVGSRRVQTIVHSQYSTAKSELYLRDDNPKITNFVKMSIEAEEQAKTQVRNRNARILKHLKSQAADGGTTVTDYLVSADKKASLVALGKVMDLEIQNYALESTEMMNDIHPEGIKPENLLGIISPLVDMAVREYYINEGSGSNGAYQDIVAGANPQQNGKRVRIHGVEFIVSNMMASGAILQAKVLDKDGVEETQVIYENADNTEMFIGVRGTTEWLVADNKLITGPLVINGITRPEYQVMFSEYIEEPLTKFYYDIIAATGETLYKSWKITRTSTLSGATYQGHKGAKTEFAKKEEYIKEIQTNIDKLKKQYKELTANNRLKVDESNPELFRKLKPEMKKADDIKQDLEKNIGILNSLKSIKVPEAPKTEKK